MSILKAAGEVGRYLEKLNISYFVIGGLALQHWGEPRLTRDVDITVLVVYENIASFVDSILQAFQPRIRDAKEFALKNRVLLVQSKDEVPIDIALGIPGFEEEAFKRSRVVEIPQVGKLRFVGPEDLIIHKCVAGRPRDVEDVKSVITRQGPALDFSLIRSWLEVFRPVVDSHDPLDLFEEAFKKAQRLLDDL